MHQGPPASLSGPPPFNGGNPLPPGVPILFPNHAQPLPPHPPVVVNHLQPTHQPPMMMRPAFVGAPPLMGLEPPPPGMSPPPNQTFVGAPLVGQPSGLPPRGQIPPLTSGPKDSTTPGGPHLSGQPPPPNYVMPPIGVPGIPPHSQTQQQQPPGVAPHQQYLPDLSRPPPGGQGEIADFFSDKFAPKPGVPPPQNPYPQQQGPPPTQQIPGYPPPPPQQYYYSQPIAPLMDSHAQYPGAPPTYDPRVAPHARHLYPPNEFNRGGNRSKRSASSSSSYSSRSPSPARSPQRISGSSRRQGRRQDYRRRSRSTERRGGSLRRYDSPDNYGRRRGPREDGPRHGHRPSKKASPAKLSPESSEAKSTPAPSSSTPSTSVSTTSSATIAAASSTAASTSTSAAAASSTTSISSSEATSLAEESKVESITDSSQDSQPQLQASNDSTLSPSVSVTNVQSSEPTSQDKSVDQSAPPSEAVDEPKGAIDEGKDDAASSNTEVASGLTSDAAAIETETDGDAVEDVLELGVEDDDLLAEVQSEDLLNSEQEKQTKAAETKSSRSRHNSDEYRKRREERERRRRLRDEEERKAKQERAEERRKEEKARRDERDRRRREKEKEDQMNRLVGKGKTLPDRPSVVKLSVSKAKSSGDETSDPQSSQAQSPAKDVPELDILDEDAMLAVFRERALLSMQEKKRQKILEKKEQRRKEKIQQQLQAQTQSKTMGADSQKNVVEKPPSGERIKRIGPVAAAVITGDPPKKIKITKKPAMTEEELEDKLLMSSDDENGQDSGSKDKSPSVLFKTDEVNEKKKPEPITFEKKAVRPLITPPEPATKVTAKAPVPRIKPPVSSTAGGDEKDSAPPTKKIISLKSSKWSTKKDEQDKENSRGIGEKQRISPSLEARLSPAPEPIIAATTKGSASVKTSIASSVTPTSSSTTSTAAAVGKKIISLKVNEERVVSKVDSPKAGTSALERLGAPVKEDESSDSFDSSSESSVEDDDTDESIATKPRASIVKLAASVKSGTAEPVHAYEVATSSAVSKRAAASDTADDGTPEARWSDAVALSKKRRAEAEAKKAGVREPISYEDLDASFNSAASRVTSSDENVLKTQPSLVKLNVTSSSKSIDSPSKISATTKDDLLDLIELTAPVAPAPSKNSVDTESLLKSLPDAKKKPPVATARPTWGRRRIEAPDSSSSSTAASSRKLVIRRSTGTAAVALATGGDARREIDVRKRRQNGDDAEEDVAGGFSTSISSPSTSPDRSMAAPSPPKKTSPGGRKLGIQRPTWLSSKADKTKPTTSVTPTLAPVRTPSTVATPSNPTSTLVKVIPPEPSERPSTAVRATAPAVASSVNPVESRKQDSPSTSKATVSEASFCQQPVEKLKDMAVHEAKDVVGKDDIASLERNDDFDLNLDSTDSDDEDDDDDALLAKTDDEGDDLSEAPALAPTEDSRPPNPSLDSDDEDLFREIDAFL